MPLQTIGSTTIAALPEAGVKAVSARVDTGAKTSAIWASGIMEKNGVLQCVLFGPDSDLYTGQVLTFDDYEVRTIASSIGEPEERYVVKLLINLEGRSIRAAFTLANRSQQVYPMLVGRNVLRNKFVVDVAKGERLKTQESVRSTRLQSKRKEGNT